MSESDLETPNIVRALLVFRKPYDADREDANHKTVTDGISGTISNVLRFSKCGPQTGSLSATWELIKNADSLAVTPGILPQNFADEPSNLCFVNSLPGDSDTC